MPDATHSQHLDGCSSPDGSKMQTVTPLKSCKTEVHETPFAASVPINKEAETRVLPAHVENGGDKSGIRWFLTSDRAALPPPHISAIFCSTNTVGYLWHTTIHLARFSGYAGGPCRSHVT